MKSSFNYIIRLCILWSDNLASILFVRVKFRFPDSCSFSPFYKCYSLKIFGSKVWNIFNSSFYRLIFTPFFNGRKCLCLYSTKYLILLVSNYIKLMAKPIILSQEDYEQEEDSANLEKQQSSRILDQRSPKNQLSLPLFARLSKWLASKKKIWVIIFLIFLIMAVTSALILEKHSNLSAKARVAR